MPGRGTAGSIRFQAVLLVLTLVGIAAAVGSLLLGEHGLWLALATCALTLLIEPVVASAMTLRLYGVYVVLVVPHV
ncbi:peptidase M48 Ste24p [Stutzerimonas stutzeri ATCC 14405 = CCUG 16156]|nr:peptidase M48 Ste24p [Stutzerimonas stutzeri ATCC 14405 = CCUG 16156]